MSFLRFGVLVPIFYFGTLLVASLFYAGYSFARQYASELGSASAPYPFIFNIGTILGGIAALLSLRGFHAALRGANKVLTWLFLISLGGFAVGAVMGGLFPMPNPLHGGFGLGFGIHLAPIFLAAALWHMRGLRTFLLITALASFAMLTIMMGVGSMVTRANVGVFQRLYALTGIPWIGIAAWVLLDRRRSR